MTIGRNAEDIFKEFVQANSWGDVITVFKQLCLSLDVDPNNRRLGDQKDVYEKIKSGLVSTQAKTLWGLLDKRASHKEYMEGTPCNNKKVLVIGAGPCGLRMAVESVLLGSHTVVLEMRDYITRNNVLHLWPFVIHDLKALGAKIFFPRFCVGSVNHISIRTLQLILLKICLILGVEVHAPVKYMGLCEPIANAGRGWHVKLEPADHHVANYDFDVIVGADGKRNSLKGFTRKSLKPKLAIAITLNLVNKQSKEEASVDEIPGLAYVFNQGFFNNMKEKAGIDLENIVYYRDSTHYFVMTPKKSCLLKKGVIKKDIPKDNDKLLARENIDRQKLLSFGREAAYIATDYKLPAGLEFAQNHYKEEDVAIFDFTQMSSANHSCLARECEGRKLLTFLVGDTLLEPFWPTGSGCARGFLGVFDAAWLMREWCREAGPPTKLLADRESVYSYLKQTKPDNLSKKFNRYTIDPHSRYGSRMKYDIVSPEQAQWLFIRGPLVEDGGEDGMANSSNKWQPASPPLANKRKRSALDDTSSLLSWFKRRLAPYEAIVKVDDLHTSWRNGVAFAALYQSCRPHELDASTLTPENIRDNCSQVFALFEQEFGVSQLLNVEHMTRSTGPDPLAMLSYLVSVKDAIEREPVQKVRKLDSKEDRYGVQYSLFDFSSSIKESSGKGSMTLNFRKGPTSPPSLPPAKSHSLDRNAAITPSSTDYLAAMKRAVLAKKYGKASLRRLRNSRKTSLGSKKLLSPPPQSIPEHPLTEASPAQEAPRVQSDVMTSDQQVPPNVMKATVSPNVMKATVSPNVMTAMDTDTVIDEEDDDISEEDKRRWRTKSLKACHGRASSAIKRFEKIAQFGGEPIMEDPNANSTDKDSIGSTDDFVVVEVKPGKVSMESAPEGNKREDSAAEEQPMTLFELSPKVSEQGNAERYEQSPTLFEYGANDNETYKPVPSTRSPVRSKVTKVADKDMKWMLPREESPVHEKEDESYVDPKESADKTYMSISRQACSGKVKNRLKAFGESPVDSQPMAKSPSSRPLSKQPNRSVVEDVKTTAGIKNSKARSGVKADGKSSGRWPRKSMKACHNVVKKRLQVFEPVTETPNQDDQVDVTPDLSDEEYLTASTSSSDEDSSTDCVVVAGEEIPRVKVAEIARKMNGTPERDLQEATDHNRRMSYSGSEDLCCVCGENIYLIEKRSAHGYHFHRNCFRCVVCNTYLQNGASVPRVGNNEGVKFYCYFHASASLTSVDSFHLFSQDTSTITSGSCLDLNAFELTPDEMAEYFIGDPDSSSDEDDDDFHSLPDEDFDDYHSLPDEDFDETDLGHLRHQTFTSLHLLEAQELQRGLVEVVEEEEELEEEGLNVEKTLRKRKLSFDAGAVEEDASLMNNWLKVVQRKQELVSKERELMLQAYMMERREIHHKMERLLSQPALTGGLDSCMDVNQLDQEMGAVADQMTEVLQRIAQLRLTISQANQPDDM